MGLGLDDYSRRRTRCLAVAGKAAENVAKEARADLERQRRLEKTFREQILSARQTLEESRELLIQLDTGPPTRLPFPD